MLAYVARFGLLLACGTWAAGGLSIWLDVPFVKQVKNGCGAACISMVMQYWAEISHQGSGNQSKATVIHERLYSDEAKGIRATDMEEYFKSQGFRVFIFKGEWSDLERHLLKGRPLIVSLTKGSGSFHYIVIVGMDRQQDIILVNDPAHRKLLKIRRGNFEKDWNGSGNWTLLAVPKSDN
jgi:ABC-type bacteriocin/lantibiotic exporter with double-glycine peptidase domain